MTNRPTTTTSLSANFQAPNALPPLLRMQHSALRQRVHFATMRHPAEEPESSVSSRSPVPFNGSDSHRTVRAVFRFSAATGRPLRLFCRRVVAIIVGTATATSQQAQPNSSFGRSPSPRPHYERATAENDTPSSPHREAHTKRGQEMGELGKKLPTYSRFSRNDFEQVPLHCKIHPNPVDDLPIPRRL